MAETKSTSPVLKKTAKPSVELSFPDAMREVINGKKVTRVSWGNDDYCFLGDPYLHIVRNGNIHQWLINDGDMLGTDWVVVKEVN